MIIINCKEYIDKTVEKIYYETNALIRNKTISCQNNNYISSIDVIDNEFDDMLIKATTFYGFTFYSIKNKKLHNPIGYALEHKSYKKITREYYIFREYWIDGQYIPGIEFKEAVNDYNRMQKVLSSSRK